MAEEKTNENKVVLAYIVKRYANGDIDVEDAKLNRIYTSFVRRYF